MLIRISHLLGGVVFIIKLMYTVVMPIHRVVIMEQMDNGLVAVEAGEQLVVMVMVTV